MRIAGNYNFAATRDVVWEVLSDPEVLVRIIPAFQKLEQVGEHEYESILEIGLPAVRGTYSGRMRLADLQPPQHYRLMVDGQGNNGFVKGEGSIDLREEGAITILDYGGEAQVGGTIAGVDQRLLDDAAKTLINRGLKALAEQIEARMKAVVQPDSAQDARTAPAADGGSVLESQPALVAAAASTPAEATIPAQVATAPTALPSGPGMLPATPTAQSTADRRAVHGPEYAGLSEITVARGAIADFLQKRPWVPWVIIAFLIGYILGRRS